MGAHLSSKRFAFFCLDPQMLLYVARRMHDRRCRNRLVREKGVGESYKSPFQLAVVVSNPCGQRVEADDVRAVIRGNRPQRAVPRRSYMSPRVWNITSDDPEKKAESLIRLSRSYYQTSVGSQRRRFRHSDLCCCRGLDCHARSRGLCRRFRGLADWNLFRKLKAAPRH